MSDSAPSQPSVSKSGSNAHRVNSVVIVGGGISGLAAAYYLERFAEKESLDLAIQLFEADQRLGGVIETERHGDFLLEAGPDSFLTTKPAAVELCRELGLAGELIGSNDERRKTYVLQGGKLRELPDGLMFVVPTRIWPVFRGDLLSLSGKLRLALAPFLPPIERKADDRPVSDFIRKRFGSEVLERLAEPLLAAVYGADVDALSTRAVLPQLLAVEEKYGNLWRGLSHARTQRAKENSKSQPIFMTLRNGLGELVERLQKSLKHTELLAGREVHSIQKDTTGFRVVHSVGIESAQAVVVSTPASTAARLLEPFDSALAAKLAGIRYHSSVIVALGYEREKLGQAPAGFGFVVPRTEGKNLTACTWVSTKFLFRSGPDGFLLRCFLGESRNPGLLGRSDEEILATTLRELREIVGIQASPSFSRISRWEKRMPQYGIGHLKLVAEIEGALKSHPGLSLAGNGYRGIGIPDCIQSGRASAQAVIEYLCPRGQAASKPLFIRT